MVALAVIAAASLYAADIRRLTLTEAVHLAISQNRALKIARLKVTENEHKKAGERSAYFRRSPTNPMRCTSPICRLSRFPREHLGEWREPRYRSQGLIIPQGQLTLFSSGTMIAQP
jgi:hypothetical protein